MREQPEPTAGVAPVTPEVAALLLTLLRERVEKGLRTYGTELHTFNGRDAHADALEELIDAVQYIVQAQMERKELEAQLLASRSAERSACELAERELALASPVIEAAREINEWEDHPHLEAALAAYDAAQEKGEKK